MPCSPGVAPVPRVVRLVVVEEGKPAVSVRRRWAERNGAAPGCAARSSAPRPSTRNRHTREAGSSASVLPVGSPREASSEPGRSAREAVPYAGTYGTGATGDSMVGSPGGAPEGWGSITSPPRRLKGDSRGNGQVVAALAVASDSAFANVSTWVTASGPSAASLTRRDRSSA